MLFNMFLYITLLYFVSSCFGQGPPPPSADEPQYGFFFNSPVYTCIDENSLSFLDTTGLQVVRINATTAVISGDVGLLKLIEQNTMILIKVEKDNNGRLEVMYTHEICDLCAELKDPDSPYALYLSFFGFPEDCPIENSVYNIQDLVADTTDLPMNSANQGPYQVTMTFYQDPTGSCKNDLEFIGCVKFNFMIELIEDA